VIGIVGISFIYVNFLYGLFGVAAENCEIGKLIGIMHRR